MGSVNTEKDENEISPGDQIRWVLEALVRTLIQRKKRVPHVAGHTFNASAQRQISVTRGQPALLSNRLARAS